MRKLFLFVNNRLYDFPIISFFRRKYYWYTNKAHIEGYIYNTHLEKYSTVRKGARLYGAKLGYHSGVNMNSFISNTIVGRYTEIAWNCSIGPRNHLFLNFTIADFIYSDKERKLFRHPMTIIGSDVWIGCNVIVLEGISVGDGAVIGAGSTVTKDIPPYAIAVGSPAKIIGYRFEESVISRLQESKWWMKDKEDLIIQKEELERLVGFKGFDR